MMDTISSNRQFWDYVYSLPDSDLVKRLIRESERPTMYQDFAARVLCGEAARAIVFAALHPK
jgi:hypothetical protein